MVYNCEYYRIHSQDKTAVLFYIKKDIYYIVDSDEGHQYTINYFNVFNSLRKYLIEFPERHLAGWQIGKFE